MTAIAERAESVFSRERSEYERDGYFVVRGLLNQEEVGALLTNFDALHAQGSIPGCFEVPQEDGTDNAPIDPLSRYPRMMHPHRVNNLSRDYMLHPKIASALRGLLGEEPLAAQSMFYWKPPGARGQALHQDNFYLKVHPGTCIAAWIALDAADRENGGLVIVPGSNHTPVVCPEKADLSQSFTDHFVRPPEGFEETPLDLAPGDCLFFSGNVIHGSYPNNSPDRFRRAFICHYVGESAVEMSHWYFPLYGMEGDVVDRNASEDGGPCGVEVKGPH